MNDVPIIKKTEIYTIPNLIKGNVYSIAKILQVHFKSGALGEPILNIFEHNKYMVYVGEDKNKYYFRPMLFNEFDYSQQSPYITNSPSNININDEDVVAFDRNLITGASFINKGHNGWFDRYKYDRCIEPFNGEYRQEDWYSDFYVICKCRNIYRPLTGTFTETRIFDKDIFNQYKTLTVFNMDSCKLNNYKIKDIKIEAEYVYNGEDIILTLDNVQNVTVSVNDRNNLSVVVGRN